MLYHHEGAGGTLTTSNAVRNKFPAQLSKQIAFGGACWILTFLFFVGQAVTQAAVTTPYSLIANQISDLGSTTCGLITVFDYHTNVCSPLHNVMNGSFITLGVLTLLGSIATRLAWPKRRLSTSGLCLLGAGSLGSILVGFAPQDIHPVLHTIGAVLGILFTNTGILLLGIAVLKIRRWVGSFSMLCGITGLISFFLIDPTSSLGGLIERIAGYPLVIWMIVIGVFVLRTTARHKHDLPVSGNKAAST